MKIEEARKKVGLSRAEMSRQFKIPIRTLEDWEREARTPPEWAELLILEKLESIHLRNCANSDTSKIIT